MGRGADFDLARPDGVVAVVERDVCAALEDGVFFRVFAILIVSALVGEGGITGVKTYAWTCLM